MADTAFAQRTRPVFAVAATVVETRTVAVASSREEDAVTIETGYFVAVYTILGCPLPGTVVEQLFLFVQCRHAPSAAPFYMGYIVLGVKSGIIIYSATIAIDAILGLAIITAIIPFIGTHVVGALFLGIVAVLPVIAGPHIIQHLIEWILSGSFATPESAAQYASAIETQASNLSSVFTFGGTSLLIIVGVAIETFRGLESELTMRNYKGFL